MIDALRQVYRRLVPYALRIAIHDVRMSALDHQKRVYRALMRRTGQIDRIYTPAIVAKFLDYQMQTAPTFVETVMQHIRPTSVIDVGCGPGGYLAEFARYGVEIYGVDGARTVKEMLRVPANCVRIHNLAYPLRLQRTYDLCLCIEVAEHIEPQYAAGLVDTLCHASDLIYFTAAPPGQGGDDHVNEQPPAYWINLFTDKGFALDETLTATIKTALLDRNVTAYWIPQNTMIFRRVDREHLTCDRG